MSSRLLPIILLVSLANPSFAEMVEPTARERAIRALELADVNASDPRTLDVSGFDIDMLRVLARSLHARVAQLENQVAQLAGAGLDVTDLQAQTAKLRQQATLLQAENEALRERLAAGPLIVESAPATPEAAVPPVEFQLGGEVVVDPKYTYEYELFLIKVSGRSTERLRDRNGALIERVDITWSEYLDDTITVRCFFRNDASYPARFSLLVGVGQPPIGFVKKIPQIMGRRIYDTPYLNPGEVHEFTLDVPIADVRDITLAGIKTIRAYTVAVTQEVSEEVAE